MIRIQTRITLLLAVTAAAFFGLVVMVQGGWRRQGDLLLNERAHETDRSLRRMLHLYASGARLHADDYTRWDEFVAFTDKPDPHWADVNITQSIATFNLDVAWVLDRQFHTIFAANPKNESLLVSLPFPSQALAAALRTEPIRHCFVRTRRGLIEIWTSPIQPSDDFARKQPIHGYYVIGRMWTAARMAELARDCNARIHLLPAEPTPPRPEVSTQTGMVTVVVPLPGINDSPVAEVLFESSYPLLSRVYETFRSSAILIFAGVVGIILSVGWALSHWVGRPLANITEALHLGQRGLLSPTVRRHDEFGHLASLVEEFFAQREKLIEAKEMATLAVAAKSQFLANISHELRTPMHGILSYSRFGIRGSMTAEREELLDDFTNIECCGTSLLSLLDDLLDLAKLEAGRMRFEFEPAPLEEIVAEAVNEFASFYHDKSMRVDIRAEGTLEPAVVDRRKLLQVMRNLLSNAGKFTPPGGTVSVRIATAEGIGRVVFEDSGTGIPEGELGLVFENFAQASNAQAQAGGTGLGLAICRVIIGAHAGRIWAENRAEGGARITLEVPLAGPPGADEPDIVQPNGEPDQDSQGTLAA